MTQQRQRQRQFEERRSDDQNEHRADGEDKILPDDRGGVPGKTVGCRQPIHVLG